LHILLTRKMGKIDAQPSREVSARPGTQRGRQPFACRFHRPVGSPGSTRAKCSAGPSTSMISISRGCRWRGGPAEMRAPRARCRCAARRSFHARNSWIGGRALPSHKSRAGNNRHDERGSIGGRLMPCQVFSKCVFEMRGFETRCSARCRQSASTPTATEAVPAPRRSHWSAPVGRRAPPRLFRDAGRATGTPEPATIERAQCRQHLPGQMERLAQRRHGASHAGLGNSGPDDAGLWSRPYTLWRADRPAICGRIAVRH